MVSVNGNQGGIHSNNLKRAARLIPASKSVSQPICLGRLTGHELAPAFTAQVLRLLKRYVEEVVMRYSLCPYLKDMASGLGSTLIVLDDTLCLDTAADAICEANSPIIHLVFPLVNNRPEEFERFGSALNRALKGRMDELPVHATFHPALVGARDCPHRLIGLLRHSPDPFVQFIPGNIQKNHSPTQENPERLFQELVGETLETLLVTLEEIAADRQRTYAPYRAAFGLPEFPPPV
ncbi:MAG: hypothetical protein EP343_02800 [Deltaproteobacteria bacterium]|nr:MAG: hypothetical protein EP343_02800 [Deltaproteobacteria bacterium]